MAPVRTMCNAARVADLKMVCMHICVYMFRMMIGEDKDIDAIGRPDSPLPNQRVPREDAHLVNEVEFDYL